MKLKINFQNAYTGAGMCPPKRLFTRTISYAMKHLNATKALEVTVRIVDDAEQQALNRDFRGKDYPTNVLSFPNDMEFMSKFLYLGDLTIAVDVVAREAAEQQKSLSDHWIHLIVHGFLHLLGYDHIDDAEAAEMEKLEAEILATMKIKNPYEEA